MNFFEHQNEARKRTRWLFVYFILAVVLITLALNLAVFGAVSISGSFQGLPSEWLQQPWPYLVTLATLVLILGTSLFRTWQLSREGGHAVARMVGAVRVSTESDDTQIRQLLNVVEEMSIAAGVRIPAVYLMTDESGINAFVAGPHARNTALVVTQGALEQLNRDQLQGVIAHEYSHIYNGDIRINTRLIGILAGVLLIGQSGFFILRGMRYAGRSRGRGSIQAILIALAMGVALAAIGYIGLFFGRLIQAAVSRQREFLADASAVQYTRNPDGIAGALSRIQQHYWGSRLVTKHVEDLSHICFGDTRRDSLLATHPPLDERIERIAPGFELKPKPEAEPQIQPHLQQPAGRKPLAEAVAKATPEGLILAAALLRTLPRPVMHAMRSPRSAKAAVYALLLLENEQQVSDGLAFLQQREGHDQKNLAALLMPLIKQEGIKARLPTLDLALEALQRLPVTEKKAFLQRVDVLVKMDKEVSLFEYLLRLILHHYLAPVGPPLEKNRKLAALTMESRSLLSALSHSGQEDKQKAAEAFAAAMKTLGDTDVVLMDDEVCDTETLNRSFQRLRQLAPLEKERLINAMAQCVLHDGELAPMEAELMRAAALVLDVPLPVLLVDE